MGGKIGVLGHVCCNPAVNFNCMAYDMNHNEFSRICRTLRINELLPRHIAWKDRIAMCRKYDKAPITESVKTEILNWVRAYDDKEKARCGSQGAESPNDQTSPTRKRSIPTGWGNSGID
jgi:hypothetical protein